MNEGASMLFGTTNASGSVPHTCCAGPVFNHDGKLILSESFTELSPADPAWLSAGLARLMETDDFVEAWRIWDCEENNWAPIRLTLYRFDEYDLVIRWEGNAMCSWQGALDTQARVLSSRDADDCRACCWQWLRFAG